MVIIGQMNQLAVIKQVQFGVYLDAQEWGSVLLPKQQVPEHTQIGDQLNVFLYYDSEDRLIAAHKQPKALVDTCAYLRVSAVDRVGAWLDWGLDKDLLLPFNEQDKPLEVGQSVVAYVFFDEETERLAASTRLRDFLYEEVLEDNDLQSGQEVDLLIYGRSDMGYKAVIDNRYLGLIFRDDALKTTRIGQRLSGFIKSVRDDKRINLSLQRLGKAGRNALEQAILDDLREQGGHSNLTDKSPPELINRRFKVSKAAYKKALGALYRNRLIALSKESISLLEK